eukprot:jgi/Botrbrau1/17900/Bobra.50_1s0001.1
MGRVWHGHCLQIGLISIVCITTALQPASARIRRQGDFHRGLRRTQGIDKRCVGTVGTWCTAFLSQEPIPPKAPPHGNKTCLNDCNNGAGVCNHDTGMCDCMAGYRGDYCQFSQKRPCTQRHRSKGLEPESYSDWQEPGWTDSRCSGTCDETRAACYCRGKYGRIEGNTHENPRALPIQAGRPMPTHCTISLLNNGSRIPYLSGDISWDDIFGPQGWCESDSPRHMCPCLIDGVAGILCDIPTEQVCFNQCSGHGECRLGFCLCHEGYYGHDCARRRAGFPDVPGDELARPWLLEAMVPPPAAADPPVLKKRLRPLIYVYDLPPDYNSRLLEYRVDKGSCVHRLFDQMNHTYMNDATYNIEMLLHEYLLQSPHRTLDPEEADFFYVPLYTSCFIHPVFSWADFPWYYGPGGIRVNQASMMALEAKRWLETHLPYWGRKGGSDHIWLFPHDEGPCWAPAEVWENSIVLSHWGRLDLNPKSNSAYWQDNYTFNAESPWNKKGYKDVVGGHPCFDPKRHLVIPSVKSPFLIGQSPLIGSKPLPRDFLLFFRGDFRSNYTPHYSRGIRQGLRELSQKHDWEHKYKIIIGTGADYPGNYDEWLMKSKFCLVVPGDGWSPRAEDAILHGCVPLVIMDDVVPVFGTILDWDKFSIRIKEADLDKVPETLLAVPPEKLHAMQRMLPHVWKRFLYGSYQMYRKFLPKSHPHDSGAPPEHEHEYDTEQEPELELDGEALPLLPDKAGGPHPKLEGGASRTQPESARDALKHGRAGADAFGGKLDALLAEIAPLLSTEARAGVLKKEPLESSAVLARHSHGGSNDGTTPAAAASSDGEGEFEEIPLPEPVPTGGAGDRAGLWEERAHLQLVPRNSNDPNEAVRHLEGRGLLAYTPGKVPYRRPPLEPGQPTDRRIGEEEREGIASAQPGFLFIEGGGQGNGPAGHDEKRTRAGVSSVPSGGLPGGAVDLGEFQGEDSDEVSVSRRRLREGTPEDAGETDRLAGGSTHARVRVQYRSGGGGQAKPKYASLPGPYHGDLTKDDAFATILAWLYSRIPAPEGPQ